MWGLSVVVGWFYFQVLIQGIFIGVGGRVFWGYCLVYFIGLGGSCGKVGFRVFFVRMIVIGVYSRCCYFYCVTGITVRVARFGGVYVQRAVVFGVLYFRGDRLCGEVTVGYRFQRELGFRFFQRLSGGLGRVRGGSCILGFSLVFVSVFLQGADRVDFSIIQAQILVLSRVAGGVA